MEAKVQMMFIPAGRRMDLSPTFSVRGVGPVVLTMAGNGVDVRRVSYYMIMPETCSVKSILGSTCYRLAWTGWRMTYDDCGAAFEL